MKKSSLITVTVAAMMGLVACNNQSPAPAPEKKWSEEISNRMVELFGEALPYVDLNAETLYSGVDDTYATWPYGIYVYYIGDDNETNLLANYGDKLVAAGYKLESDEDGNYYTKTINDSTVSVTFEYVQANAEEEIAAGNEIQVAYSGEMLYGGEGNLVGAFVESFFGDGASDYVEAGDDAVYDGTDASGNPEYTGGASFGNAFYTAKNEANPEPTVVEDFFPIVAYSKATEDPEDPQKVTYEDPYMVEFGDSVLAAFGLMMMNLTDRMVKEDYAKYIVTYVEDQPILYIPGSAILGVYAFYAFDEEFNPIGVYVLDVAFDQYNLTVAQLPDYFGPTGAKQIENQGYFVDGVISIVYASISCVYISLQEDVPTDPAE